MAIDTTVTLKRLIAEYSIWATAHPMVNDFGYGKYLEEYVKSENKYLTVIVNSPTATSSDFFINYSWEVICLDYVLDEKKNRDRVNSDTMDVLRDLENTVRYSTRWKTFSRVDADWSYRKVDEFGADKSYGWIATFTLKVKKKHGICDIKSLMPTYDFEMGSVVFPSCDPVTFAINGTSEDEFASGSEFDLTLVDTNGNTPVYTYDEVLKKLTVPAPGITSIDIDINGVLAYNDQSTDVDIPVINQDSNPVGTWTGASHDIDNSLVSIKDEEGNELHSVSVLAEGFAEQIIASATQTMNGSPISGVLAEGSKAITVAYANATPVGTVTTDTTSALHIEIPNPVIPIPSGGLYKSGIINSYTGGDEGNDPPGIGHDWYLLSIDNSWLNEFGNNLRFTGTTGGGYNGSAYVDVDGNPTTKALAYPNDIMLIWNKYNQSAGNVLALMFNPLTSASLTSHLSSQPFTYDGKNDWKVMTYNELGEFTRINQSANGFLDYPPIDYSYAVTTDRLWTRTPAEIVDFYYFWTGVFLSRGGKTTSYKTMVTRLYTLTELGL